MAKHILVTGGNSGIGLALCKLLIKDHGCYVYLGSRDLGRGEAALKSIIDRKKPTIVKGDFNICIVKEKNNALTLMLEKMGFLQLMMNATHIGGGHIDHCYWLDTSEEWDIPTVERYSPYWSDHDGLLVTLRKKNCS